MNIFAHICTVVLCTHVASNVCRGLPQDARSASNAEVGDDPSIHPQICASPSSGQGIDQITQSK